jgi:hypothetical protein
VPPRLFADAIDSYAALRDGLCARASAIGISRESIDHIGRLPSGYAGKLLGEGSTRAFGIRSLGSILKTLGLRIALIEDPESMARTTRLMGRKRSEPQAVEKGMHWRSKRNPPAAPMRGAAHDNRKDARPATASELGQRGARARNASMTKAERSAAARRAASARWGKPDRDARSGVGA